MENFIILIGGPGTFKSCDPGHDKIWLNYFYPIQIAAEKDLYHKRAENVHWVVYEPAYSVRWLDDSEITFWEGAQEALSGKALHKVRKKAADNVISKGASSYVERIKNLARGYGITYKGINKPQEFWDYLASFPSKSISRVWYSGHATPGGLILQLTHNSECEASWTDQSTVLTLDIPKQTAIKDRFIADPNRPSKFYGCATADFASSWHVTFAVPSEGAKSSITFAGIFGAPDAVITRLETTPTPRGAPDWTKYP
ncbi:hypothetical protein QZJ86_20185 [Methylomonas montana]|uniref:hypothetical protein n=1 Tax=Methylomonas montana TaxID=3058963 RepID=UPI002659539C|nr:hypothetical protein [Methylomonas montana]WKJ90301.1 hypothetical protein QZJ86_20185 [Methylomonas montana]